MKKEDVFDRIRARTSPETRRYVQKNLTLVVEIGRLMKEKGWTQKDLAKKMGKSEPEISKWLGGLHNLTLKSIAKLEVVLDADLLKVPEFDQQPATMVKYVTLIVDKSFQNRTVEAFAAKEKASYATPIGHSEAIAA